MRFIFPTNFRLPAWLSISLASHPRSGLDARGRADSILANTPTRMKTLRLLIAVVVALFASLPVRAADDAARDRGTAAEKFYAGYVAQVEANKGDHSSRLIILRPGTWRA